MATGDPPITLIGNLTADPELRFTPSGAAVVSFTVAVQPRKFDKASNSWVDGEASFYRCTAWRQFAENIANSFSRGNRVIVFGTIAQRSFETREGDKRTTFEVQVDDMGASTKFALVSTRRPERTGDGAPQAQRPAGDPWGSPPAEDPWSTPQQAQRQPVGQQQTFPDDPPF